MRVKVAVPIEDESGLESRVSEHFGRTPHYLVLDVDLSSKRIIDFKVHRNPYLEDHKPGVIPLFIKNLGVNAVVCCNIGFKAVNELEKLGVRVYRGYCGRVSDAVKEFLESVKKLF